MGFIRPKRRANVTIADGDYEGLELGLSLSISLGDFINFQHNRWSDDSTLATQVEAMDWFADNVLIDWNLTEDDGETPVPADSTGFRSLEPAMAITIVNRWRDAVTEVEIPLGLPSRNGVTSVTSSTQRQTSPSALPRRPSRRR
jgi:hypothetical protein